ncbi:38488_t:CDS:2, partial [Gigaspora margarita]
MFHLFLTNNLIKKNQNVTDNITYNNCERQIQPSCENDDDLIQKWQETITLRKQVEQLTNDQELKKDNMSRSTTKIFTREGSSKLQTATTSINTSIETSELYRSVRSKLLIAHQNVNENTSRISEATNSDSNKEKNESTTNLTIGNFNSTRHTRVEDEKDDYIENTGLYGENINNHDDENMNKNDEYEKITNDEKK